MKKFLVTTTIYPRREAIEKFEAIAQQDDWTLIVVGDIKTPHNEYRNNKCIYLSPDDQIKLDKELSDLIGWNCIQRRTMGFLLAYRMGADILGSVDDDNIPMDNWGKDIYVGQDVALTEYQTNDPAFDPIGTCKGYGLLWHRGFPIQLVGGRQYTKKDTIKKIDVQANFWNGDPDIDAIERFIYGPECYFQENDFPFSGNKLSPFNSQNTIVSRDVIPFWPMLPGVGRGDDIIPSYYVQANGFNVGYFKPTVYQARNEQNLTRNMENEYLLYSKALDIVKDLASGPRELDKFLPEKTLRVLNRYQELCS